MTSAVAGVNNPNPTNTDGTIYVVKSGDCLWNIAMAQVLAEAKAQGKTLSDSELQAATAKELQIIEQDNQQILGPGGSGTYDLIYPGDEIVIPGGNTANSFAAAQLPPGAAGYGFNPPKMPSGTPYGLWEGFTPLQAGQDIISSDGKYDLVMQQDGNLVLYQLKTPYQRSENYLQDTPAWASNTNGSGATQAVQDGGNIVLKTADGTVVKTIPESSLPSQFQIVMGPPFGGLKIG